MVDSGGIERIWIESTADPTTGRPMCLVRWGEKEKLVESERVIATARELFGAAASAEADVALLESLRSLDVPDEFIGAMIRHAREARAGLRMPEGAKPVFRIGALAGGRTGLPLVSVELGSHELTMDTAAAREVASDWYETAVASMLDVRIRYVLGDHGFDVVAVEQFMTDLSLLSSERRSDEPR